MEGRERQSSADTDSRRCARTRICLPAMLLLLGTAARRPTRQPDAADLLRRLPPPFPLARGRSACRLTRLVQITSLRLMFIHESQLSR